MFSGIILLLTMGCIDLLNRRFVTAVLPQVMPQEKMWTVCSAWSGPGGITAKPGSSRQHGMSSWRGGMWHMGWGQPWKWWGMAVSLSCRAQWGGLCTRNPDGSTWNLLESSRQRVIQERSLSCCEVGEKLVSEPFYLFIRSKFILFKSCLI